jgi:hypothetical protein
MNYNIMNIFKWELASVSDFLADYYNIYFVAFSILDSINDHKVSLDVYRRMSNRSSVSFISQQLSMAQALWIIKQFDRNCSPLITVERG